MGGCQNYGPFVGALNNRCRIIIGIILGFYGDNGKENGNYYIGVIYTQVIPFWGTLNNWCRIIIGIQKGTIILTTTHMAPHYSRVYLTFWYPLPGVLMSETP